MCRCYVECEVCTTYPLGKRGDGTRGKRLILSSASGPASGVCKNGTGVSITAQSVSGDPNVTSVSNSTSGETSDAQGSKAQFGGLAVASVVSVVMAFVQ